MNCRYAGLFLSFFLALSLAGCSKNPGPTDSGDGSGKWEYVRSVIGITISRDTLDISVSDSVSLSTEVSPSDATNKEVIWSSSNSEIASVTSLGTVTGKTAGTANIIATTKDGGYTAVCAVTVHKIYRIRDTGPAGGIVFYDKGSYSDGWRYMEASDYDVAYDTKWNNGDDLLTGAQGTEVGTGKSNTQKIVDSQGPGEYAATACTDYIQRGYRDWFLPSKDELNYIYTNLIRYNKIKNYTCTWYWSSSEYNSGKAWVQIFEYGGQGGKVKGGNVYKTGVIAARVF